MSGTKSKRNRRDLPIRETLEANTSEKKEHTDRNTSKRDPGGPDSIRSLGVD